MEPTGIATGHLKGQVNTGPISHYFRWLIPPSLLLVECIFHVDVSTNERRVHICHCISHTSDLEVECSLPRGSTKI